MRYLWRARSCLCFSFRHITPLGKSTNTLLIDYQHTHLHSFLNGSLFHYSSLSYTISSHFCTATTQHTSIVLNLNPKSYLVLFRLQFMIFFTHSYILFVIEPYTALQQGSKTRELFHLFVLIVD